MRKREATLCCNGREQLGGGHDAGAIASVVGTKSGWNARTAFWKTRDGKRRYCERAGRRLSSGETKRGQPRTNRFPRSHPWEKMRVLRERGVFREIAGETFRQNGFRKEGDRPDRLGCNSSREN